MAGYVEGQVKFVKEARNAVGAGWRKGASTLHGGPQARPPQMEMSVVTRHLSRYKDLSTQKEEELVLGVMRIVAELLEVGTEPGVIKWSIHKMARGGPGGLRSLPRATPWPMEKQAAFALALDAVEIVAREEERRRVFGAVAYAILGW